MICCTEQFSYQTAILKSFSLSFHLSLVNVLFLNMSYRTIIIFSIILVSDFFIMQGTAIREITCLSGARITVSSRLKNFYLVYLLIFQAVLVSNVSSFLSLSVTTFVSLHICIWHALLFFLKGWVYWRKHKSFGDHYGSSNMCADCSSPYKSKASTGTYSLSYYTFTIYITISVIRHITLNTNLTFTLLGKEESISTFLLFILSYSARKRLIFFVVLQYFYYFSDS